MNFEGPNTPREEQERADRAHANSLEAIKPIKQTLEVKGEVAKRAQLAGEPKEVVDQAYADAQKTADALKAAMTRQVINRGKNPGNS